jgi:pre-rRNA-processing protein IPI1
MMQMETERAYEGDFKLEQHPEEISKLKEWVIHLPRVMWEIGSQNLLCTEVDCPLLNEGRSPLLTCCNTRLLYVSS